MKPRQRELIVTVKESNQPADVEAFLDAYVRALLSEVEQQSPANT